MPCNPSPCGANAVCKERNNAGSCSCLPEYFGDPYAGCRPECVQNSDCDRSRACINQKCVDPCPGVCGRNSECAVINHSPICSCFIGYTGNPSTGCYEIPKSNSSHFIETLIALLMKFSHLVEYLPTDPCQPSPCGSYSDCKTVNGHAVCSCLPTYIGSPPACRPECVVSSECSQDKACMNQKCKDPCPGTCGQNAKCQVINHSPICSCPPNYIGDPFIRCIVEESMNESDEK